MNLITKFETVLITMSIVLLLGCSAGKHIEMSNIQSISIGMTEDQVIGIMGTPVASEIIGKNGEKALTWGYLETFTMTHEIYIVIVKDGKIIKAPKYPDVGRGV
jgi:outer membrane protein assembly factor BamE (lipoprotein component of BamABCDE complex)